MNFDDLIKERYTFSEIIQAQKMTLDEKIEVSVEVLLRASKLSMHHIALAFSGGKDSEVVADLIERFLPELHEKIICIFGNTGIEFPESLRFARKYGRAHYGDRFVETKLLRLENDELRYDAARRLVDQIEREGALDEILKSDGKLKGQNALIQAADRRGYERTRENYFFAGHPMNFAYCVEQYGAPLLGKSASKLDAHRINIECFLKYSESASARPELLEYYNILRECKFSQHCCKLLKKAPSERVQAERDVDMIIKGLMASESHSRMVSLSTRGHIFPSTRPHIQDGPFYHVSPIGFWTDDDVWAYIRRFGLEYGPLYDIEYEASDHSIQKIKRNGCMLCGTDIQFSDNHLAILRQTHPKAWRSGMEHFGYQKQIMTLFRLTKSKSILNSYSGIGRTARIVNACGEQMSLFDYRPCAFDDIGGMVELDGTGLNAQYDPEAV